MVTIDPLRSHKRWLAALLGVVVVLASTAPAALATHTAAHDARAGATEASKLDLEEATPEELRELVGDLTEERDSLARSLERFTDLYDPLEADRQLLFELRKSMPDTRPEAESHIDRLRTLAMSSDPARLGRLADRVEEAAPKFFDWRYTEFATPQEATQAYLQSGANAFDSAMTEFRSEALLSVATRLDGLLTVLDRIR